VFYAQFAAVVLSTFFVMVLFLWLCYRYVYNQTTKQTEERMRGQRIQVTHAPDVYDKDFGDAIVKALRDYKNRHGNIW